MENERIQEENKVLAEPKSVLFPWNNSYSFGKNSDLSAEKNTIAMELFKLLHSKQDQKKMLFKLLE